MHCFQSKFVPRLVLAIVLVGICLLYIGKGIIELPKCAGKRDCAPELATLHRKVSNSYMTRDAPKRGYLAVLEIPEQFSAAVRAFLQLYMINQRHWKLVMTEPYVLGSRLAFVPPATEDLTTLPMISKYLNRTHMLRDMQTCLHTDDIDLSTFSEFLLKAPRNFVVLQFVTTPGGSQQKFYECDFNMMETETLLNSHFQTLKNAGISRWDWDQGFVGVKSLCIAATHQEPFSMKNAAENLTRWMSNHANMFSYVIPEWRSAISTNTKYYYYDPNITSTYGKRCTLQTTPYTRYVIEAARDMTRNLSLEHPFIGIHVRSERVAQQEVQLQRNGFIDECVENLTTLIKTLKTKHGILERNIVFVHDAGAYGSQSMGKVLRAVSNDIITKIERLNISNAQYTPIGTDASSMSQFVELEFLASADVLVTVGFGGFQARLIKRFKQYQGSLDNWYTPCDCMSLLTATRKQLI